jgi:hypothetical protein
VKSKRLIFLTGAVVVVLFVWLRVGARSEPLPVLVFRGYAMTTTNTEQVANFELRNVSSRAIWLCFEGREFPLGAPFLERLVVAPTETNNAQWTNISFSVGSYFMHGEKLLPGRNLPLTLTLTSNKPASTVGIEYYVGRFADGNDFVGNLGTRLLNANSPLKDKATFYWERAKRRLKAPKRYEVWCPQVVCFQVETSDVPAVHPGRSSGGER